MNPLFMRKIKIRGGLFGNFPIKGFRFDRFVHFSFPKDEYLIDIYYDFIEMLEHPPISSNYYHGYWLKHPAQNNLAPLSPEEKVKIIVDFVRRPLKEFYEIKHYGEWLRCQYGDYFSENFPYAYTRKYWGIEPEELETKWVGERMYSSQLEEIIAGSFTEQSKNFYYTSVMRYPKNGGFRSILNRVRKNLKIELNAKVLRIDTKKKKIYFKDNQEDNYDYIISTLPLPELVDIVDDVPTEVKSAGDKLMYTSGYQISLGFNRPDVSRHLWFYIYDEDIPPARVYSPSMKSPDNAPLGCSSLQAEVFFNNRNKIPSSDKILNITIDKLINMGLFSKKDMLFSDIRFEKYANIIFCHDIYNNREIVINYLHSRGIKTIGRFGRWDYLWSHQAFQDGVNVGELLGLKNRM